MENMDKYKKFTEISENSGGTANKKYQSYQEQLQAAQNRLAAAWEKLAQDADIAAFIKMMTNFATAMVKSLPVLLKTLTRLIAIWQGYKIPTLMSRIGNFTGIGPMLGTVGNVFSGKASLKEAISRRNEEILNYGNGQSNRFGLGETNNILNQILGKVSAIQSGEGFEGVKGTTKELVKTSEQQAANAEEAAMSSYVALENEKLKVTYAEEGAQYGAAETYQSALQVQLAAAETNAKAAGSAVGNASNYTPNAGLLANKNAGKGKMAAVAIAGGIAGIASGVMTTGATHKSAATGQNVESSSTASNAMKGASAGINAVGMIGYAWGPVIGMVTQTIASMFDGFFTPLIGKWIDADRDARNARVETAQKQLSSLETIEGAVSSIESTVSSKAVTYEENQELVKQMKELRNTLLENIDMLQQVTETMGVDTQKVFDSINNWANMTQEERQSFLYAIEAAIDSQKADKTISAAENDFYDAKEKADEARLVYEYSGGINKESKGKSIKGTVSGNVAAARFGAYQEFEKWAAANNVNIDYTNEKTYSSYLKDKNGNPIAETWNYRAGFTSSGQQLVDEYKSFIDWLSNQDTEKYASVIQEYQKIIREYESELAKLNEIYKEANSNLVAAALLQAKISTSAGGSVGLLSANYGQLKRVGKNGIYDAVAAQLLANGGLRGYSVYSKEGRSIIEEAIKSNERLYAVWTGQIYTLKEALSSQNTEVMRSFATALGVSVEELSNLENELGDLTLADILGSPADTRSKISEITSLFTSMATSSGLSAENMESIINKFPQLISKLKDSVSLGSSMLNIIDQYNSLYSRQLLSDLLNNDAYFDEMMKELQKRSPNAYNDFLDNSKYGGATTVQGILGLLAGSYEESGVSKETYDLLKSLYSEYFDFTVQSSLGTEAYDAYVSYWNKVWDKQIANLEEQKAALQEINKQREYENKLVEARLRLEESQKEKRKVWREGVGFVYEANQETMKEAQENLEQVEREQTISELEQQIAELNYMKERLDQITENTELENLKSLWDSFLEDKNVQSVLSQYSAVDLLQHNHKNITEIVVDGFKALENYLGAKESTYNSVFGSGKKDAWGRLVDARDTMNNIEDKGSQEYYNAEKAYNDALHNYQSKASEYKNQYGDEENWDANLSAEQQSALTASQSNEAYGTLMIKNSNGENKFRTGEEISPINNADVYNDLQKAAHDTRSGSYEGTELETWKYTPGTVLDVTQKGSVVSGETFRNSFGGSLENWAAAAIADHPEGVVFAKDDDHSKLGIAVGEGYLGAKKSGMYELNTARRGSLGLNGGPTLINEEGTEAIITPSGTITSLPSGTGVVPADVTKGVWQLGELAPSILRALGYTSTGQFTGSGPINNSDSVNIGSVYMQVSADAGFDPEHFVELLKAQAALSKNNRR